MSLPYGVIEVFTSEQARHGTTPLYQAIVEFVRMQKIAARCIVTKGVAGCYENGEVATHGIEVLSFNMPLKIEIILPMVELERILPEVESMVSDGIVVVEDMRIRSHRLQSRLIPRHVRVRDAMTPAPQSVLPDAAISDVIQTILHARFNGVPVVDPDGKPVGIVTQGDLIRRAGLPVRKGLLADFDQGQVQDYLASVAHRKVSEIMTRPVITIEEDKTLSSAVDLMIRRNLKRLPVVNPDGRMIGMLARFDVFRAITRETPATASLKAHRVEIQNAKSVADLMETDTPTVLPDTPIEEVIRIVDTSDIQRVAVVDAEGTFLGLISDKVLLDSFADHRTGVWKYLMGKLPFTEIGKHQRQLLERLKARVAADVMKSDVVVVRDDAAADEAIRIMVEKGIKRLPVLDATGRLRGLVSRDSLLRMGVPHE